MNDEFIKFQLEFNFKIMKALTALEQAHSANYMELVEVINAQAKYAEELRLAIKLQTEYLHPEEKSEPTNTSNKN